MIAASARFGGALEVRDAHATPSDVRLPTTESDLMMTSTLRSEVEYQLFRRVQRIDDARRDGLGRRQGHRLAPPLTRNAPCAFGLETGVLFIFLSRPVWTGGRLSRRCMSFVNAMVDALIAGTDGAVVVERIRAHYRTQYSFEKNVSNVRRAYLSASTRRHPDYAAALDAARVIAEQAADLELLARVERFADMPLIEQYDTLRSTRRDGFAPESSSLSRHFASLPLLPSNMASFVLTKDDLAQNAVLKQATLHARNSRSIVVVDPSVVLQQQIELVQHARKFGAREILALLLMCGRRETELLNGRSTFDRVPGLPCHALFTGALKKRGRQRARSFRIPLLCTFTLFERALQQLRASQQDDTDALSNRQISRRYCGQLCAATRRHFPYLTKPHDLRAVYVRFVDCLFEHAVALPLLCMQSLGHETMAEALHYMVVTFTGDLPDASNGPWACEG